MPEDGRYDQKKGKIRLLMAGLYEIRWWVLSLGLKAALVAPAELKPAVRQMAK